MNNKMNIYTYTNNYNNLKISNYNNYDNEKWRNFRHAIKEQKVKNIKIFDNGQY